jgi:hypothetical protein
LKKKEEEGGETEKVSAIRFLTRFFWLKGKVSLHYTVGSWSKVTLALGSDGGAWLKAGVA